MRFRQQDPLVEFIEFLIFLQYRREVFVVLCVGMRRTFFFAAAAGGLNAVRTKKADLLEGCLTGVR